MKRQFIIIATEVETDDDGGIIKVEFSTKGRFAKKENISSFLEAIKMFIEEWPHKRKGEGVKANVLKNYK